MTMGQSRNRPNATEIVMMSVHHMYNAFNLNIMNQSYDIIDIDGINITAWTKDVGITIATLNMIT